MRLMRLCAAAVLAAGMSVAAAQPPGGGRGGPGGGMFGQAPLDGLVNTPTVQTALKVTDEQKDKLKAWGKEFAGKAREIRQEKMQGVDRSEWMQKMPEISAAIAKEAYKELETVLKADQVKRLRQVEVQVAGPQAFAMPEVQTALKLTDDQKDKLKDAQQAMQREVMELMQELRGGGGRPDRAKMEEMQKKQAGLAKELMGKVEGMLTAEQMDAWKGLTGDTVDVAKVRDEMPRPMFRPKKDD